MISVPDGYMLEARMAPKRVKMKKSVPVKEYVESKFKIEQPRKRTEAGVEKYRSRSL